jgi:hypothetical protein
MGNSIAMQSSKTYRQFQAIGIIALWILGMFAVSVQVFTRKGFGERYMSVLNILFGLSAIGFFTGLGNLAVSSMAHEPYSQLMELLYTSALCLAVYHRFVIWRKNRRNVIWHSMYSGRPMFAFTGIDEGTLKRWIEPALLLGLSYIAKHVHQSPVSMWLLIGGIAVFVHETLAEYMQRAALLDARDAMIEANYRQGVATGKATSDLGFSMSRSSVTMIQHNPELELGYSDEVRQMIDPQEVTQ